MNDENFTSHGDANEAKMARADLYKLANYSMKLFKMIQEGQELESWVQAKITKSADYIASVYHFMEYEMQSSEFGSHLEGADMYSESVRRAFEQKLLEAKAFKAKMSTKAKKELAVEEGAKPDFLDVDKDGNKTEPMKKALKSKKASSEEVDEDVNKSDVPAFKRKASGAKDWKVSQADLDKEANDPKHISSKAGLEKRKKELDMSEGSTGDYSAKKGAAGKDLGKPGKNFAKIAAKAEKGGAKSGEAVAGAVLKKLRAKESVEPVSKKKSQIKESQLVEFSMAVINHPKFGKIEWLNHGGSHMIATKDPVTGSLKIHVLGTHEQIASKWAKLKASIEGNQIGVVESVLNKVIKTI